MYDGSGILRKVQQYQKNPQKPNPTRLNPYILIMFLKTKSPDKEVT